MAAQQIGMAQITATASLLLEVFRLCDTVADKIKNGEQNVVVSPIPILALGHGGFHMFIQRLKELTNMSAEMHFQDGTTMTIVTASALPTYRPPKQGHDGFLTYGTGQKPKDDAKVPRPMNAFLIYRWENHGRVATANPGLSLTEISKIIGAQWRREPKETVDAYKVKAEEAKAKHATTHPGYQYRPRKPSDVKKRYSKKRVAEVDLEFRTLAKKIPSMAPYMQDSDTDTVVQPPPPPIICVNPNPSLDNRGPLSFKFNDEYNWNSETTPFHEDYNQAYLESDRQDELAMEDLFNFTSFEHHI